MVADPKFTNGMHSKDVSVEERDDHRVLLLSDETHSKQNYNVAPGMITPINKSLLSNKSTTQRAAQQQINEINYGLAELREIRHHISEFNTNIQIAGPFVSSNVTSKDNL